MLTSCFDDNCQDMIPASPNAHVSKFFQNVLDLFVPITTRFIWFWIKMLFEPKHCVYKT